MYDIEVITEEEVARKVGQFLTSTNAFDQTWAPHEKAIVENAPIDSLQSDHHQYWYVMKDGHVIGAVGVRENKYGSGGYEMDADYIAVHKDFRKQGIATRLLQKVEEFVQSKHGRYIHVLSCDIPSYAPARSFYEKQGYKKVAEIPDYYVQGEGRIDYLKKLQ